MAIRSPRPQARDSPRGGIFPKKGDAHVRPFFGRFKGMDFLREGGNRNPPSLKPFLWSLSFGKESDRENRAPQGAKIPGRQARDN